MKWLIAWFIFLAFGFNTQALAEQKIYTIDFNQYCQQSNLLDLLHESIEIDISEDEIHDKFGSNLVANPSRTNSKTRNAFNSVNLVSTFFELELNWQSIDNTGVPIILLTNLSEYEGNSCSGIGASFRKFGKQLMPILTILKGDDASNLDIANDLDVVAHEFGHGVFSSHNGYWNASSPEKGGINEAVGDILGATVSAWRDSGKVLANARASAQTFIIGKNYQLISVAAGYGNVNQIGIRSLANPILYDVADHYSRFNDRRFWRRGRPSVHKTSGIISLPYYLMVQGGRHPNSQYQASPAVSAIGFEKSVKIIHYIFQHSIPFETMPEFASAAVLSAKLQFGEDSYEMKNVKAAFSATGLIANAANEIPESEPAPNTVPDPETESMPENPVPPVENENGIILLSLVFGLSAGLLFFVAYKPNKPQPQPQFFSGVGSAYEAHSPVVEEPNIPSAAEKKENNEAILFVLGADGQGFKVNFTSLVLGRDLNMPEPFNSLLRGKEEVSRKHCEIWFENGKLYFYDFDSTNGTYVNGHKLTAQEKTSLTIKSNITAHLQVANIGFDIKSKES